MSISTQARRQLLNLVLLLVVSILGGLVWQQSRQSDTQQESLLNLAQAINQITITRYPDSDRSNIIQIKKQADYWLMQTPKQVAVNPVRLRQLFTLLDEPVEAVYDAAGKDLRQYELEPGNVRLTLNDQVLLFGMSNPVSGRRYILHDGHINMVSEAVYGLLMGDVTSLISGKLVPPGKKLQSIGFPKAYVSQSDTLQHWQSADAMRVEPLETSIKSQGTVILKLDDGSQISLNLLVGAGELVLANTGLGIRYILPEALRSSLLPAAPTK